MRPGYTFLVVVGSAKPGRCKYCRSAIVWAIAVTKKGAKTVPFTCAPAFPTEVVAENGVRYQQWRSDLLHVVSCPNAPARSGARA